ncbi:MAG: Ig-like domain-containing protein [Eubacterium ventriosum]
MKDQLQVDKSVTIKAVTYRKGMLLSDPVQSDIIIEGTISLNKTEATVAIGNKLQLSAITDQSVTFSSDNAGVAKVDVNGLVEGVSKEQLQLQQKAANGQKANM